MAVPGHDERDWEFARDVRACRSARSCAGGDVRRASAYVDSSDGVAVHSTTPDGRSRSTASGRRARCAKITAVARARRARGASAINYKLRDWLFSRQRYWGEPFPIVWVRRRGRRPLPEHELPVRLPEIDEFKPSGTAGEPAGERHGVGRDHDRRPTGEPARRETNTMPQWAGSCWYYLRFLDPHNRERARRPGARAVLDAGRPLHRRRRARRAAPALRALLAQGAVRHRRREHARAVHEARPPGHGPRRGRPEDVEVGRQRRQPRRHGRALRRRRRSALRDVHGTARASEAVEHARRRGHHRFLDRVVAAGRRDADDGGP